MLMSCTAPGMFRMTTVPKGGEDRRQLWHRRARLDHHRVLVLRRSPHVREEVRRVAFRLTRRRREKTTSADVSGLPSAKWGFFVSLNVNVFASALVQDRTSDGTGRNATVSQGYVRPGHRRLRGHPNSI